jgi:hypothetical protein
MANFRPGSSAAGQTVVNDEALIAALGGLDLRGYGAAIYALPADLEPGAEAGGCEAQGEGAMPSWLEEAYAGDDGWCEGGPAEEQAPQSPSSYHRRVMREWLRLWGRRVRDPALRHSSFLIFLRSLYKTELCRSFEETGACRYAYKCQVGAPVAAPALRFPP